MLARNSCIIGGWLGFPAMRTSFRGAWLWLAACSATGAEAIEDSMRRTKVERSMGWAFGEGRMGWDIRTKCKVQGR